MNDLGDRMSFNGTILLAAIALKFAYSRSLPELPYLTLLDWKSLISVAICTAVIIIQVCQTRWKASESTNKLISYVLVAIVLLCEVVYWHCRYYTKKHGEKWLEADDKDADEPPKQFIDSSFDYATL